MTIAGVVDTVAAALEGLMGETPVYRYKVPFGADDTMHLVVSGGGLVGTFEPVFDGRYAASYRCLVEAFAYSDAMAEAERVLGTFTALSGGHSVRLALQGISGYGVKVGGGVFMEEAGGNWWRVRWDVTIAEEALQEVMGGGGPMGAGGMMGSTEEDVKSRLIAYRSGATGLYAAEPVNLGRPVVGAGNEVVSWTDLFDLPGDVVAGVKVEGYMAIEIADGILLNRPVVARGVEAVGHWYGVVAGFDWYDYPAGVARGEFEDTSGWLGAWQLTRSGDSGWWTLSNEPHVILRLNRALGSTNRNMLQMGVTGRLPNDVVDRAFQATFNGTLILTEVTLV